MKKSFIRTISALTVFFFVTSTLAWSAPGPGIELLAQRETPSFLHVDIPQDLATVDEIYEAPPKPDPRLILHIQNAHGNYEAQLKIKKLLEYLYKTYSFKLLFLEGAAEKLDPEFLKLFPEEAQNLALANAMAQKGELTGAEYYLMNAPTDVDAIGVEETDLYKTNYEDFKQVYSKKSESDKFLGDFEARLETLSTAYFSTETRRLLSEWKKFEAGHRDFLPYVKRLTVDAKKILGLDLESLFSQVQWPQLTRLLVLQSMEKDLNAKQADEEKKRLLVFLKEKRISSKIISAIETLEDKQIRMNKSNTGDEKLDYLPRYLLEQLVEEAGPKGFYFHDYPAFSLYAGYLILKSEMESKALFDEIESLFDKLLNEMTATELEKNLLELFRDEKLLRKLFHLEMTRQEWLRSVYRRDWLEPQAMVKRLTHLQKGEGIKSIRKAQTGPNVTRTDANKQAPLTGGAADEISPRSLAQTFDTAMHFYDIARQRESVFYATIRNEMTKRKMDKAVLITGGFHTDGLMDLFRGDEVSYGILTPRLTQKVNNENYISGMLEEDHTIFDIAQIEQFLRATTGKSRIRAGLSRRHEGRQQVNAYLNALMRIAAEKNKLNRDRLRGYLDDLNRSKFFQDPDRGLEMTRVRSEARTEVYRFDNGIAGQMLDAESFEITFSPNRDGTVGYNVKKVAAPSAAGPSAVAENPDQIIADAVQALLGLAGNDAAANDALTRLQERIQSGQSPDALLYDLLRNNILNQEDNFLRPLREQAEKNGPDAEELRAKISKYEKAFEALRRIVPGISGPAEAGGQTTAKIGGVKVTSGVITPEVRARLQGTKVQPQVAGARSEARTPQQISRRAWLNRVVRTAPVVAAGAVLGGAAQIGVEAAARVGVPTTIQDLENKYPLLGFSHLKGFNKNKEDEVFMVRQIDRALSALEAVNRNNPKVFEGYVYMRKMTDWNDKNGRTPLKVNLDRELWNDTLDHELTDHERWENLFWEIIRSAGVELEDFRNGEVADFVDMSWPYDRPNPAMELINKLKSDPLNAFKSPDYSYVLLAAESEMFRQRLKEHVAAHQPYKTSVRPKPEVLPDGRVVLKPTITYLEMQPALHPAIQSNPTYYNDMKADPGVRARHRAFMDRHFRAPAAEEKTSGGPWLGTGLGALAGGIVKWFLDRRGRMIKGQLPQKSAEGETPAARSEARSNFKVNEREFKVLLMAAVNALPDNDEQITQGKRAALNTLLIQSALNKSSLGIWEATIYQPLKPLLMEKLGVERLSADQIIQGVNQYASDPAQRDELRLDLETIVRVTFTLVGKKYGNTRFEILKRLGETLTLEDVKGVARRLAAENGLIDRSDVEDEDDLGGRFGVSTDVPYDPQVIWLSLTKNDVRDSDRDTQVLLKSLALIMAENELPRKFVVGQEPPQPIKQANNILGWKIKLERYHHRSEARLPAGKTGTDAEIAGQILDLLTTQQNFEPQKRQTFDRTMELLQILFNDRIPEALRSALDSGVISNALQNDPIWEVVRTVMVRDEEVSSQDSWSLIAAAKRVKALKIEVANDIMVGWEINASKQAAQRVEAIRVEGRRLLTEANKAKRREITDRATGEISKREFEKARSVAAELIKIAAETESDVVDLRRQINEAEAKEKQAVAQTALYLQQNWFYGAHSSVQYTLNGPYTNPNASRTLTLDPAITTIFQVHGTGGDQSRYYAHFHNRFFQFNLDDWIWTPLAVSESNQEKTFSPRGDDIRFVLDSNGGFTAINLSTRPVPLYVSVREMANPDVIGAYVVPEVNKKSHWVRESIRPLDSTKPGTNFSTLTPEKGTITLLTVKSIPDYEYAIVNGDVFQIDTHTDEVVLLPLSASEDRSGYRSFIALNASGETPLQISITPDGNLEITNLWEKRTSFYTRFIPNPFAQRSEARQLNSKDVLSVYAAGVTPGDIDKMIANAAQEGYGLTVPRQVQNLLLEQGLFDLLSGSPESRTSTAEAVRPILDALKLQLQALEKQREEAIPATAALLFTLAISSSEIEKVATDYDQGLLETSVPAPLREDLEKKGFKLSEASEINKNGVAKNAAIYLQKLADELRRLETDRENRINATAEKFFMQGVDSTYLDDVAMNYRIGNVRIDLEPTVQEVLKINGYEFAGKDSVIAASAAIYLEKLSGALADLEIQRTRLIEENAAELLRQGVEASQVSSIASSFEGKNADIDVPEALAAVLRRGGFGRAVDEKNLSVAQKAVPYLGLLISAMKARSRSEVRKPEQVKALSEAQVDVLDALGQDVLLGGTWPKLAAANPENPERSESRLSPWGLVTTLAGGIAWAAEPAVLSEKLVTYKSELRLATTSAFLTNVVTGLTSSPYLAPSRELGAVQAITYQKPTQDWLNLKAAALIDQTNQFLDVIYVDSEANTKAAVAARQAEMDKLTSDVVNQWRNAGEVGKRLRIIVTSKDDLRRTLQQEAPRSLYRRVQSKMGDKFVMTQNEFLETRVKQMFIGDVPAAIEAEALDLKNPMAGVVGLAITDDDAYQTAGFVVIMKFSQGTKLDEESARVIDGAKKRSKVPVVEKSDLKSAVVESIMTGIQSAVRAAVSA